MINWIELDKKMQQLRRGWMIIHIRSYWLLYEEGQLIAEAASYAWLMESVADVILRRIYRDENQTAPPAP